MKRTAQLCERFGDYLAQDSGIQSLSRVDRSTIRSQLAAISFDLDANAFLRLVLAELSFCNQFGQKRSHETCDRGCHFTEYLCQAVRNCASNRLPMSVRSVSQALAWFLGDEKVDLQHLKIVLPYALAHRIQWKEEIVAQSEKESRSDPLEIYMARKAVNEMHRRYMEQGPQVKDACPSPTVLPKGGNWSRSRAIIPFTGRFGRIWKRGLRDMKNPFGDFQAVPYQKKEIPLKRIVQAKQEAMHAYIGWLSANRGSAGQGFCLVS